MGILGTLMLRMTRVLVSLSVRMFLNLQFSSQLVYRPVAQVLHLKKACSQQSKGRLKSKDMARTTHPEDKNRTGQEVNTQDNCLPPNPGVQRQSRRNPESLTKLEWRQLGEK